MDPKVWGKHMWFSIHFVALGYPEQPSDMDKYNYRSFYENLHKVLMCEKCAKHYVEHLKELPLQQFLDNRQKLFEWTVRLHNIVNRSLGKPEMSVEDAYTFYTSGFLDASSKNESSEKGYGWSKIAFSCGIVVASLFIGVLIFQRKKSFKA
jgi:hypothetical protein